MSKLELFEVKGKQKGKILDATFAYIKLQSGDYKFQSKTEKEYSLDIVVDKATAKEFKKAFPKNGYKEVDTSDFEKKFKIPAPFPEQEEQYVIKLRADTVLSADVGELKAGDVIPYEWHSRPKMYFPAEGGVEDVTMTHLASNGSKGDVSFNVMSNSYGQFPQLTGVLVKEFIPYESSGGASSDFGVVVGGYNPGDGNVKQVPTEVSTEVPTEVVGDDGGISSEDSTADDFDNIPF